MSDICLLVCCLHAFRDLCEITGAQVRGYFVPKKKGLFTEILKMTSTISESEVITFITSHIVKMNSHHNLTHHLIIYNLILSYNLYSSWIICSLVALQPIFKNAFLAWNTIDCVCVCVYKEFWLHFILGEIQNFCVFWPNMDFHFLYTLVWRRGYFIVSKSVAVLLRSVWLFVQSSKPLRTLS
jgi:hypothetical protein